MQFMGKEEQVVVRSQHANVFLGHPSRQKLLTSRWVVVPTQQQQPPIFVLPPKNKNKMSTTLPCSQFFRDQTKKNVDVNFLEVRLFGRSTNNYIP